MLAEWNASRILIFAIPFILVLLGAVSWIFLRKTFRSRGRVQKQLLDDPDINEWLVVFGWSRKILYFPTIAASVVAGVLVAINQDWGQLVGGIWLGIFFLNFLVDEYEMSIKVLLIVILCAFVLSLWLSLLGWFVPFLRFFRKLDVVLNWMAYLVVAGILLFAILVSWLRGLFYYVAITPNYMNVQVGPTETGEQISREEYSTRIDTGDFLERLLGFGRIVITFSDQRRQPLMLLVGKIGKKAARLESIRGKLAFDRFDSSREGPANS